jgi:phenylacetate-coenzyme A ligase PaaK-like adenylate-forming protein
LYTSGQTGTSVPAVISEHDLEKISDRVFKSFDADGSGKRKHSSITYHY